MITIQFLYSGGLWHNNVVFNRALCKKKSYKKKT